MTPDRDLMQRRLVRVPDVKGQPLKKALLLLQQAGLSVESVLYKESYQEKDEVIEQEPRRGQMVYSSQPAALWVSRESYIKWLPSLYQRSDATGKNFVRDLLWITQHMFGSIEERLEVIHTFFDSYEAPEEFIPWLASWSAMVLEADWPTNKKRRLIKKAMELYRLRGTVRGMGMFISLFTGFEPMLRENEWPFQGCRVGISSAIGVDTVILPPVDKSAAFVVVMPHQFRDVTPESVIRLHEIIEMEKPANTSYMLKFEEPRSAVEEREFFQIGIRSGINIGEEIVTPLPVNPETGEPELPKEIVEPPSTPDPSVYELFGTPRRQVPIDDDVPRADNAPVERWDIASSKFGFEGAREFKLDDILQELSRHAEAEEKAGGSGEPSGDAVSEDGTDETAAADGNGDGDGDDPAKKMLLDYGDVHRQAGRGGGLDIEIEQQVKEDDEVHVIPEDPGGDKPDPGKK